MAFLEHYREMNTVKNMILEQIDQFDLFRNIYLFGSIIKGDRTYNDIDLLLVYEEYNSELLEKISQIRKGFYHLYSVEFDMTIMSEKELKETRFIERLVGNYYQLKGDYKDIMLIKAEYSDAFVKHYVQQKLFHQCMSYIKFEKVYSTGYDGKSNKETITQSKLEGTVDIFNTGLIIPKMKRRYQ